MKEKLLTSGQVAELCQVSVPTVLNWINLDLLPSYKTAGGHNRISPLGLLRFLDHRKMFVPPELYEMAQVKPETFSDSSAGDTPVAIVADDDPTVRTLIREVLESVNYMVVEVNNGLETCLQMGILRPELLILDIMMPGMDGMQVVHTISKHHEMRNTRIIVVSGAIDKSMQVELAAAGVQHVLKKPVPITEFIRLAGIRQPNTY